MAFTTTKCPDYRIFLRNGFPFMEQERMRIGKALQTTFGLSLVHLLDYEHGERIDYLHAIGGTMTQRKALADAWMALHRYHLLLHERPDYLSTPEIRSWIDGFPEWAQQEGEES